MSEFFDISSFIEKTVQDALADEAPTNELGTGNYRVGERQALTLNGAREGELALLPEINDPYTENAASESDAARPVHRGSFAANLWSGPSFFANQILKRKAN